MPACPLRWRRTVTAALLGVQAQAPRHMPAACAAIALDLEVVAGNEAERLRPLGCQELDQPPGQAGGRGRGRGQTHHDAGPGVAREKNKPPPRGRPPGLKPPQRRAAGASVWYSGLTRRALSLGCAGCGPLRRQPGCGAARDSTLASCIRRRVAACFRAPFDPCRQAWCDVRQDVLG